jgi:hypothetical protein
MASQGASAMTGIVRRLRDAIGVLVYDVMRYRRALARSGARFRSDAAGWISLRNRSERLLADPGLPGLRCDWIWGSNLHAPGVLPGLGRKMMRASLAEWPIEFENKPRAPEGDVRISFIFAHGGKDRLPQLKRTIRSIFAQKEVAIEVVVIDQSPTPLLFELPMAVIYRHVVKPAGAPEWHKTWAYNIGARVAKGSILVFHDGDVCVPTSYAREIVDTIEGRGFAAASLQRFLYYLDPSDTQRVEHIDSLGVRLTPERVFQNWKGGTIAIKSDAFASIGGFDEGFDGWGGEDAEFYDRCAAIGHCRFGYLPFVHLWHPAQPSKSGAQRNQNMEFFQNKMLVPREQRIERLRQSR